MNKMEYSNAFSVVVNGATREVNITFLQEIPRYDADNHQALPPEIIEVENFMMPLHAAERLASVINECLNQLRTPSKEASQNG